MLLDQYFDGDDYDDPIKLNMQNDYSYYFIQNHIVEKEIKVRINKVVDYTNLWYEFQPREYTFFSIEHVNDYFQQDDGSGDLMRFHIVLDSRYSQIERRVYTFYDMLGQIGGFIGIVLGAGGLIAGFFANNIYVMALLTSLFKVEVTKMEKAQKKSSKIMSLDHSKTSDLSHSKRILGEEEKRG